ncbi:hypothetical protein V1J52_19240 [Streptomyces sp. TRM 70351]|uniref:hypothetical protein n=1 Tax=Streptomyces sp. TRM 70351 TaxID=3116552 RepID=UPI002E7AC411|nr:hypothetical protein [Streptomyces sp. TRM 70351]MEE1930291.1 hypothetical protein [Streptomyces sp. TRM 70351]
MLFRTARMAPAAVMVGLLAVWAAGAAQTATGSTPAVPGEAAPGDGARNGNGLRNGDGARHRDGLRDGAAEATGLSVRLGDGTDLRAAEAVHPRAPERREESVRLGERGSAREVTATADVGAAGNARADAALGALELDFGGAVLRTGAVTASCTAARGEPPAGQAGVTGGTVTVAGLPPVELPGDAAPGTVVALPAELGRVVLNERERDGYGSLTVTALRLEPSTRADGRAADRHGTGVAAARVRCAAAPPEPARIAVAAAGPGGEPVGGAAFEAVRAQDGLLETDCVTDDDGRCELFELDAGPHDVCVVTVPPPWTPPGQRCRTVTAVAGSTVDAGPFPLGRRVPGRTGAGARTG